MLKQLFKENLSYNLFIDKEGGVWLWSYIYGAFLFNPQDNSIKRFDESSSPSTLNSNHVCEIIQDDFGLIWVATDHGGVTLIDKKNHFSTRYLLNDPKDTKSLGQNTINTIYKDDQGIIWLGTYKQGVNYLNENIVQFPYYHHKESDSKSLQYDDDNCFLEDKLGNIWIGTNGGGLIYFDRKNNTFKQYLQDANNKSSISSNVIVSLCIDDNGILWIGTFLGGLCSFDGKYFKRYLHNEADSSSLASNNVWELYIDRDKNLWVGTLGGGLDIFDKKTNGFKHNQFEIGRPIFLPSNNIASIIQDKKGNLWVATDNGVAVFNINKHTSALYQHTSVKNSLSHNNSTSLLEDTKGRIWVGTREGLNLFNEETKSFQTFTMADGLPSNMILNIVEDKYQSLWITTANGLRNIIPEQKKTEISLSVKCYDEMNNLPSNEFNYKASYKTRDGALIFGGPSGFNIINPAVIRKLIYHPEIVFTGLQIFNENIEPGDVINNRVLLKESLSKLEEIDLKFKENVFSIEFASLDFAHSALDKYSYMLEGFKSDWLYTDGSQRRVTYTNLDPGHYTFKVKVQDRNGMWSEIKTLKIYIVPPFWRTPIAYIIYLLL
jgi:ligand-binding sensor domain-containing protein